MRGTALGVPGGIATAVTLDAALLGWEPAPPTVTASRQNTLVWQPCLTLSETRTELSVRGQF